MRSAFVIRGKVHSIPRKAHYGSAMSERIIMRRSTRSSRVEIMDGIPWKALIGMPVQQRILRILSYRFGNILIPSDLQSSEDMSIMETCFRSSKENIFMATMQQREFGRYPAIVP